MKDNKNFTLDSLSNLKVTEHGDYDLITDKGKHVLTMIHPVQINEQEISEAQINQFKADLRLHQNAVALYECLEEFQLNLQLLKDGKISIFNLPIDTLLQEGKNVLKRANEID